MTINLNNLNKKLLTKDEIFKHIDDWSIYQYYSDFPLEINKLTNSPLRVDNKPSFALFIGESSEICFKDFNLSSGDCIKFVQLKYNLNYYEALSKIAIDFGFNNDYILKRNEDTDYNLAKPEKTLIYKNKDYLKNRQKTIVRNREKLYNDLLELSALSDDFKVYNSCANFVFVKTSFGKDLWNYLKDNSIVIRFMGDYIRISVGTEEENEELISCIKTYLSR